MSPQDSKHADITKIKEAARILLLRGQTPIPLPPEDDGTPSKKPLLKGWQDMRVTVGQIDTLFTAGCNIGWRWDTYTDVDLDCGEAIFIASPFLKPSIIWGRSSAPHSHHVYDIPDSKPEQFKDPLRDDDRQMIVEIRHGGQQSMIPPSVHPTGEQLVWETSLLNATKWTYPELRKAVGKIAAAVLLVRYLKVGSRHHTWLYLAGAMRRADWSLDDALNFMRLVSCARRDGEDKIANFEKAITATYERTEDDGVAGLKKIADEEYLPRPVVRKLASWLDLKKANVDPLDLSDSSNAACIFTEHGEDLRFLPNEGKGGLWLFWNDVVWQRDHLGYVNHLAASLLKNRADALTATTRNPVFIDRVRRELLNASGVNSALDYLQWCPDIATPGTAFDANPWLLGVQNGVYDLRSDRLEAGAREHLVSRQVTASYDPNAMCPRWIACLERAQPNADVRAFLQRLAGACLLGQQTEHGFVFNYGRGANFKTAFSEALRRVMGNDYSCTPNEELFFSDNQEVPKNYLADLHGMRLLTTNEKNDGSTWNVEFIKRLLGGQELVACRKYCEAFSFVPTARVIAAANNKPRLNELDEAIRRRFLLIPWEVTIPESVDGMEALAATEVNPEVIMDHLRRGPRMPFEQLMSLLLDEKDGILKWMIDGARDFIKRGLRLDPPVTVRSATENYFEDENLMGRFVKDWCTLIKIAENLSDAEVLKTLRENGTTAAMLHEAFTEWSQFGKHPWGKQKVTQRLEKVDGVIARRCSGNRMMLNLALNSTAKAEMDNRRATRASAADVGSEAVQEEMYDNSPF